MRPITPLASGTTEQMIKLLKQARNLGEHKRIQCILLRARDQMNAQQISEVVGYHVNTVRRLHHEYLHLGEAALKLQDRGGRRRENMTLKGEERFLKKFKKKAEAGELSEISQLHSSYEKEVGRRIPPSTIYRLLQRHQWRKIVPRPLHPKNDPKAMDTFKKTPRTAWCGPEQSAKGG